MRRFKTFLYENSSQNFARHYFAESELHGLGSFAKEYIPENDVIFLFLQKNHVTETTSFDRTDFCRLTNHSYDPNMTLEYIGENIYAISARSIKENEELTINYEDALDLIAIKSNAAINEKVLRITPGYEYLVIENDTDKDLLGEIQNLRKAQK